MWRCHYCRYSLSLEVQSKNHLCPQCGSDIHACKNCSHYDENLTSKCLEPNSPWVRDRNTQNTCPYFEFGTGPNQGAAETHDAKSSEAERAKEAFRALFRNL